MPDDVSSAFGAFTRGLSAPIAAFDAALTEAALREYHAAARIAWPAIDVSLDAFAAELAQRLGDGATPAMLAACCATDVYLAIASHLGNADATREIVDIVGREVAIAGRKTNASADQAAEVQSEMHRFLWTAEPTRRAALHDFSGRGDLRGYLRVIATRELVRLVQRDRREAPHEDDALFALLTPDNDAQLAMLRGHYQADVSAAVRAALATLDERSRALLRFAVVDGWTVDRIGLLYSVHRATAARWVASARDTLGEAIRAEVASRLSIEIEEVDSIVRLVQSRLDISLVRLIGDHSKQE